MYCVQDTIVAPATIPGTGAISIIRLSGPDAISLADSILSIDLSKAEGYTAHHAFILMPIGEKNLSNTFNNADDFINYNAVNSNNEILDEVVVTVFKAPKSFTGEDCVEISCHASSYIVSQIIYLLIEAGARNAEPGEFTQRAFLSGKMDLSQAEAVADLIASQNKAAHKIALSQLRGGISAELKVMRAKLLEITSLMELELDFSEEEVEFADKHILSNLTDEVLHHISKLRESFRLGNAIKNGVPVAIVGSVNTGKSTLLNAILGDNRAIVSDIPGTTRDTVEETIVISGILFRFIDTAGIRETSELVEKIGIERTLSKIETADIIVEVVDSTASPEVILQDINNLISKVNFKEQELIILANKTDLQYSNKNVSLNNIIITFLENKRIKANLLEISAKYNKGIDELKELLQTIQSKRENSISGTMVSNARHYDALNNAYTALSRVRTSLSSQIPTDLIAQDLRESLYYLGTITGEISTDEVLGQIFSKFCIGK